MSTALVKRPDAEWEWTPQRERCLELVATGWPKTKIAEDLKVARNTVIAWCQHPAFIRALAERTNDEVDTTRTRRARETRIFADRTATLVDKALKQAETRPSPETLAVARAWGDEFRRWRAEERQDTGDNVQRRDVRVVGQVMHEHSLTRASFKTYIESKVKAGVIDVEALEGTEDPQAFVVGLAEQALLSDGELSDAINEDDRAQLAAEALRDLKPHK